MVHFNKVRYPEYTVETTCPLFQSARHFRLWESSCEIRSCFDEVNTIIGRKDSFSSFTLGNIIEMELDDSEKLNIICYNKVIDICERCLSAVSIFNSDAKPLGDDNIVDLTESGDEGTAKTIPQVSASQIMTNLLQPYTLFCKQCIKINNGVKSVDSNTSKPVLSLLSVITLGAAVCFQSYLCEFDIHNSSLSRPSFLLDLNAGGTCLIYALNL